MINQHLHRFNPKQREAHSRILQALCAGSIAGIFGCLYEMGWPTWNNAGLLAGLAVAAAITYHWATTALKEEA